tara:strand:+ start:84 stop:464 length:381 start_codon:yes stop_codon:yes gene_type:complete
MGIINKNAGDILNLKEYREKVERENSKKEAQKEFVSYMFLRSDQNLPSDSFNKKLSEYFCTHNASVVPIGQDDYLLMLYIRKDHWIEKIERTGVDPDKAIISILKNGTKDIDYYWTGFYIKDKVMQ